MQIEAQAYMPSFNRSDANGNFLTVYVHTEQESPEESIVTAERSIVNLSCRDAKKYKLQLDSHVVFSEKVQLRQDYLGIASKLLSSAYRFSRKSNQKPVRKITLPSSTSKASEIISLAESCIKARQLANGRGDIQGSSHYFINIAKQLSQQLPVKLTVIEGEQLLKSSFRMHHAVGRASRIKPAFINLAYNGNKDSPQWLAFVGKGVLFDTGGINLKSNDDLSTMFLDKHAACSCLVAFETIVRQKIKINLTVSLGFAQNCIGSRSYRPSDILVSRKGLTVKVADTDAEGRLILADAMNWTQQTYKVTRMVEMSTLTYSCMKGLGRFYAGVYSNDEQFQRLIIRIGKQVAEEGWPMPLTQDHHQMLECSQADCLSDVDDCPGGSIGAAFLQKFIESGVKWVHLDVLGVSIENKQATGWGAKLLIHLGKYLSFT